jgi:2-polyprenyl-6-hydroxyphenyl methylase / 3-demethylubiquinone-9 3-methyltransferase
MAETPTNAQMNTNVDPQELEKFAALAHRWWDPDSEFKPLHDINPLRLDYIDRAVGLKGKTVLDVGCGGGILSEAMSGRGASVTGIDLGEKALKVAQLHRLESGAEVDYQLLSVEDMAAAQAGMFDVVTCMELLEHVPDPGAIVSACARLLKPGGHLFMSTINRNPKSYLFAVIGAEYVLNLLPRGTHEYEKFIKPSELSACCRHAGVEVRDITGMSYNPITKRYWLDKDVSVNYLMHAVKP